MDNEMAAEWLKGHNRELFLCAWRKIKKKRGGKLMIYRPRIAEFYLINGCLECQEL